MKRPCLERGCPNLTPRTRCPGHERTNQRQRDLARGTTAQRGYGGHWQALRLRILERDGHRCIWCGLPARSVDHLVPKALGGTDDPANLAASCGTATAPVVARPDGVADGSWAPSAMSLSPARSAREIGAPAHDTPTPGVSVRIAAPSARPLYLARDTRGHNESSEGAP